MNRQSTFAFKIRYWLRFRTWPQDIAMAQLNLRAGHEIYHVKSTGLIAAEEIKPWQSVYIRADGKAVGGATTPFVRPIGKVIESKDGQKLLKIDYVDFYGEPQEGDLYGTNPFDVK